MSPGGLSSFHAAVAATLLLALSLLGSADAALALAALEVAVGLFLIGKYRRDGQRYGRHPARVRGDRRVVGEWLTGLVPLGVAIGLTAARVPSQDPANQTAWAFGLTSLGLAWVSLLLSTWLDWFYVMPRLSGLAVVPPCQQDGMASRQTWQKLTRIWLAHRSLTAIMVIFGLGFALGSLFGAVVFHFLSSQRNKTDAVAALIAAAVPGAVLIAGAARTIGGTYLSAIQYAGRLAIYPHISVGDYVALSSNSPALYVLDVATEGAKLIDPGRPLLKPHVVGLEKIAEGVVVPAVGERCTAERCFLINLRYCDEAKERWAHSPLAEF